MKKLLDIFLFVFLAGCSAYTDPTATTQLQAYPPPVIQTIALYQNQVELTIWSHVVSTDFTNNNGYLVYLSTEASNISNVANTLTNNYNDVTNKPFLAAQAKPFHRPDGTQSTNIILSGLATGTTYYVTVTCFGINSLAAKVFKNKGWVESEPAAMVSFAPRKEFGFTLSNYFESGGGGSALDFSGTTMAEANANANPTLVNNSLFFRIHSNSSGQFVPSLSVGPLSTASLQGLGIFTNFRERLTLPASGYLDASSGAVFPVSSGYIFALKLASGSYAKIVVTNVKGTPSITNATMSVEGFGAWLDTAQSRDL